ncbi:dihydroxy-acid dehydratase [Homarus gammarus nudivirus]|uniref:Dihydroxy-acid dehydratase n=1 Tax=Homarus gammarus nudivirus TaxID=2509616 RepID=A0A411HB44_9VIRU|nr:dihydroxy-acid dehydratase [Homarus gammarus nudivirus]QBB28631.1 dihydroxy-acid dehydratase [Homarus gammarus nudivirus]
MNSVIEALQGEINYAKSQNSNFVLDGQMVDYLLFTLLDKCDNKRDIFYVFSVLHILVLQKETKTQESTKHSQFVDSINFIDNYFDGEFTVDEYNTMVSEVNNDLIRVPRGFYEEEFTIFDKTDSTKVEYDEYEEILCRNVIKIPRNFLVALYGVVGPEFADVKKPMKIKIRYVVGKPKTIELKARLSFVGHDTDSYMISAKKCIECPMDWLITAIYGDDDWSHMADWEQVQKHIKAQSNPDIRVCYNCNTGNVEYEIESLENPIEVVSDYWRGR